MKTLPIVSLVSLFFLSSCGERETAATVTAPADSLEPFFVSAPQPDARAIHTVRDKAQPGDTLTLAGLVMGREKPFVEGRAAFILGDPEVMTHCAEIPGDECETPWDVCCESPENKRIGTATVQFVDEDGRVLKQGLRGVGGLTELSEVTVTGTVADSSTSDALVINARKIHVKP